MMDLYHIVLIYLWGFFPSLHSTLKPRIWFWVLSTKFHWLHWIYAESFVFLEQMLLSQFWGFFSPLYVRNTGNKTWPQKMDVNTGKKCKRSWSREILTANVSLFLFLNFNIRLIFNSGYSLSSKEGKIPVFHLQ